MGRILILFFVLVFSLPVFGQEELFFPEIDSITIDYRSDNHWLDSVDAGFIGQINLRPASGFEQIFEYNLANNFFANTGGLAYDFQNPMVKPKFSGLPYVGFQYAFGSAVTQDLKVEYQQYYTPKSHLHLQYDRRVSNGFLRNGDYTLNDLSVLFYHQKGWYATNFSGYFGSYDYGENGGMSSDSLLIDFPIEYTPINTEIAKAKTRKLNLKWDNYFRLAGDSLIGFGLKSRHQYRIIGREYIDDMLDPSLFDTLYLDSARTRDQYQTMHFANGAGVYFDSPYFKVDGTINYQHWRNQNSGVNRDTNELFIHSNLWASLGNRIYVTNEFYFNVLGAIGELKEYASVKYDIVKNLTLRGNVNFENLYPTPYQRFNTSNYYQWNIASAEDLKMQQKLQLKGSLKYGDTSFIQANVIWTSVNNGRYFIDDEWRQDTLNFVTLGAVELKGALRLGKWGFYPTVTYRFNAANFAYQPEFSTMNRISFSTKLFKAKKLGMAIGVDVGYETAYQYMLYNSVLDVLSPVQTASKAGGQMRLNAFLALSIDQFRFFVKAENLSSIWNDPQTRIDVNYPIMPFIMRAGITWDFFN